MATLTEQEKKQIRETREKERTAAKGFAREAGTRSEAAAQRLRAMRGEAGVREMEGVEALEMAATAGQQAARRRAAQGLAATQAAGGFGGGGTAAALRGTAAELGTQEAQMEADAAARREQFRQQAFGQQFGMEQTTGQAEVEAAAQQLLGEKFAREAGIEAEDRQQKMRQYQTQMAQIKKDAKGSWYEADDEEAAADAIEALAQSETDPELAKMLQAEADRIRKEGDFAF